MQLFLPRSRGRAWRRPVPSCLARVGPSCAPIVYNPRPPLMDTPPQQPLSARKKLAFSLVLLVFFWLLVELACWAGLWALEKYKGVEYTPALVQTLSDKHRGILQAHIGGSSSYVV